MDNVYFLKGKRIFLRPLEVEDVNGPYLSWVNDKEITKYLDVGLFPTNKEDLKSFILNKHQNRSNFAICTIAQDLHIGNCSYSEINWIHRIAGCGIMIGNKDYWGKNIMQETYSLLIDYAFNTLSIRRITAGVVSDNLAAIITLEKLGFQTEGLFRKHRFYDGKYVDIIRFGLFSEEFIPFSINEEK